MNSKEIIKSNQVWTFSTYFAQGFPFSIVRSVFPVFLRDMKVSLESIGLTSLFGLAWVLKFLWGPLIDKSLTKKKWLGFTQSFIGLLFIISSFFVTAKDGPLLMSIIFFIVSVFSATNDIAIDGYYLSVLNKDEQAKFLGFRVMAYRIAMITGTGLIVTIGTSLSWTLAFLSSGVLMLLVSVFHYLFLKEPEQKQGLLVFKNLLKFKNLLICSAITLVILVLKYSLETDVFISLKTNFKILEKLNFPNLISLILLFFLLSLYFFKSKIFKLLSKNSDSYYSKAFFTFIDRESIGVLLFFIITLRTGEWMLGAMFSSFIVDLGIKVHYGWLASGVALPASIIGAMAGGWAIYKYGIRRLIWPFIVFQNSTNILYALLAYYLSDYVVLNTGVAEPSPIGAFNIFLVAITMATEQLSAGVGTSVLMIYLMKLCSPEYKSTHYAIGSGLMSITGIFAGILSGIFAGSIGYAWTFFISFLFAVPAMLVIPFLPEVKK